MKDGGGATFAIALPQTRQHKKSGLKKFFQVIILKEFCDIFFSNQNHANQRKQKAIVICTNKKA